jgi:hypothetical protein
MFHFDAVTREAGITYGIKIIFKPKSEFWDVRILSNQGNMAALLRFSGHVQDVPPETMGTALKNVIRTHDGFVQNLRTTGTCGGVSGLHI